MRSTRLVANLVTPEAPTAGAVREFLREFLGDPMVVDWPAFAWRPILDAVVLRVRPPRVAKLYASIWTADGAPLRAGTERIVERIVDLLGPDIQVAPAYRYGSPGIERSVAEALRSGPVTVLSLFPHQTASTTGTIDRLVARVAREGPEAAPDQPLHTVRVVHPEPDDPGFIEALARRWEEALASSEREPEHVVLSYHGIPVRHDRREGRTYSEGCLRTTSALLDRINWPATRATTAFQSCFGPEPWLRPATDATLVELARKGVRDVAILTPGFVTEGLETVEEIGEEARESFLEAGGRSFLRVPCVGDHPAFADSLARLARQAFTPEG
jgi:protoporphyrin/coproporphyrin ferrochelatase